MEQWQALRWIPSREKIRIKSDANCRINYYSRIKRFTKSGKIATLVTEINDKGKWRVVKEGLSRTDAVYGGSRFLRTSTHSMCVINASKLNLIHFKGSFTVFYSNLVSLSLGGSSPLCVQSYK